MLPEQTAKELIVQAAAGIEVPPADGRDLLRRARARRRTRQVTLVAAAASVAGIVGGVLVVASDTPTTPTPAPPVSSPSSAPTPSVSVARPEPSADLIVKTDLVEARDALEQLLAEDPTLSTDGVTGSRLRSVGYVGSKKVVVWLAVKQGGYCLYGVPREAETMYGIDAKQVWFTSSVEPGLREARVVRGRPALPGEQHTNDYVNSPCVNIESWTAL